MENYLVSRTNLKVRMVEEGMSRKDVCHYLGITYQCFNSKLNGSKGFTENEMSILVSLFGTQIFLFIPITKNAIRKEESNDTGRKRVLSH